MKKYARVIAGVSVAALALAPNLASAADLPAPAEQVEKPAATSATQYVKVIILTQNQPTRPGGEMLNLRDANRVRDKLIEKYGIKPDRSFGYLLKGFSAYIPEDRWNEIAAEPEVASIERTAEYQPLMDTAGGLTYSTQARADFGVSGEGIVIAVIDTGVDITHEAMKLDDGAKTKLEPAAGFTKKVPWGYNYADENTEVNDTTGNEHGIHVTGIAAANGGKDANLRANGRINGIAPNAQVLALKVFSNENGIKGGGASSEDIIAALEDAVKHDADVINMSLGSSNGFAGSQAEQRAVKMATDKGIEVVVAAANDGLNFSAGGNTVDAFGKLDDGTLGSPATADTALAVASVENSFNAVRAANVTHASGNFTLGYGSQAAPADGQAHQIVNGGLGNPQDIPVEAAGKYVLIKRGAITFEAKVQNALAKGATGVVIYNHEDGGETIPGMAGVDKFNIFVGGMTLSHGKRLHDAIAAGETTITFTNTFEQLPNATAKQPSSFTSWGADTSLAFRPHLSGIGGNVLSTQNNNDYANNSGTSMAAPHVAGATALVLEKSKEKYPDLSVTERRELNRIALANTAQILLNPAQVPYSARQVGAGLINTKAAIQTDVYATVEGSPWVALKELNAPKTFTVTLDNRGTVERTYQVNSTCVVDETNVAGEHTDTRCNNNERMAPSATSVTVPAGGTATVDFTITPDTTQPHWVSAWAQFVPAADVDNVPELVIPALGFVGDWNKEPIFDAPEGEPAVFDALFNNPQQNRERTGLVTPIGGNRVKRAGTETLWISPNGDGYADVATPFVASLRNAAVVRGTVLKGTEVVREVGKDNFVRRSILGNIISGKAPAGRQLSTLSFDGNVYNKQTGEFETAANGEYTYRVSAQLSPEFAPQEYDFKLGVDSEEPTVTSNVEVASDGKITVTGQVTDQHSGVDSVVLLLNGTTTFVRATVQPDGNYTAEIPAARAATVQEILLVASDQAGNESETPVELTDRKVKIDGIAEWLKNAVKAGEESAHYNEPIVKDGVRRLSGTVADGITSVRVNGDEVQVNGGRFETTVNVTDGGRTTVRVEADGYAETFAFTYDSQAPVITLSGLDFDPNTGLYFAQRAANGKVRLTGQVTDGNSRIPGIQVTGLGQEGGKVERLTGQNFDLEFALQPSTGIVVISTTDGVNQSSAYVRIVNAEVTDTFRLSLGDLNPGGLNIISKDDEAVVLRDGKYYYSWDGILTSTPSRLVVNGQDVPLDRTGFFNTELPLEQGINDINVKAYGANGDLVYDTGVKILFDTVIPTYTLEDEMPKINADGAIYLKQAGDVNFRGTVTDNAFGFALALNGNVLEYVLTDGDPTPEANQRTFDTTVAAADGDIMLLGVYDQFSSFLERKIPVVVDGTAPTVSVNGVEADAEYKVATAETKLTKRVTVTANDANLANLRVLLDNQEVGARVVSVVPHPKASLVEQGDVTPGVATTNTGIPTNPAARNTASTPGANNSSAATTAEGNGTTSENTANGALPATLANTIAERAANAEADANQPAAAAAETTLDVTVEFEVGVGDHVLAATAGDKADNLALANVPFSVVVAADNEAKEISAEAATPVVTLKGVGKALEGTQFTIEAAEAEKLATFVAASGDVEFPVEYSVSSTETVTKIEVIEADGTVTTVNLVYEDGKYTFTAPSNATIKVTHQLIVPSVSYAPGAGDAVAAPALPGTVEANVVAPTAPAAAAADAKADAKATDAKTTVAAKAQGTAQPNIPNTGSVVGQITLVSALMLVAGAALLTIRKRRNG